MHGLRIDDDIKEIAGTVVRMRLASREGPIDWNRANWDSCQREVLRRNAKLSLEEIVRAIDEISELADRLQTIRNRL